MSFCVFYFYQNQEFISYFLCVSTCGVETVNFLSFYVSSEPVKFRVNHRSLCSTVTWLCQLVTAEEELYVRQIIFWKFMNIHLNSLHWQSFEQVSDCSVCAAALCCLHVGSFVLYVVICWWLCICLFPCTAFYTLFVISVTCVIYANVYRYSNSFTHTEDSKILGMRLKGCQPYTPASSPSGNIHNSHLC